MKKLFKDQKESLYKVQKDLGMNHGTLYKYANGLIDIRKMPIDTMSLLAKYFNMNVGDLYPAMIDYQKGGKQ